MLLAMRKEECSVATSWPLAAGGMQLVLPDHGCLIWYLPGSQAPANTHDDVQVLPCLSFWGPYILHLPHLKLGSLLIRKTSQPLESARSFSRLLCITSEDVSLRLPRYFYHLSTMALHCQAKCQAPLRQLILFPGYSLESQAQLTL